MLKVRVAAVGRLREQGLGLAAAEYATRLARYCDLEVVEVEASRQADPERRMEEEGERLMRAAGTAGWVIACDRGGRQLDSLEFAELIGQALAAGEPISFLVGGAEGLLPAVVARARTRLSFSRLTFPHELFRVFLLEQIYRAFRILRNEPYHR